MTQFLKDYGYIISVIIIPIGIWIGSIWYQNRQLKIKAKLELFLKLMANRKKNPISIEWADALNQIDIVFQSNKYVRMAWRAYFDSLHPKSQHFDNQNSFRLDLLSEIAKDLGYKNIKQTEIDRFYSPQFFGDKLERQDLIYREYLRVLLKSKSMASELSEDEYHDNLENIQNPKSL